MNAIISKIKTFLNGFKHLRFLAFSKSTLKFEHFQKKDYPEHLDDLFPKLRTPTNLVRYMSKKSRFKGPFDRQHGKRVQTLLQSEPQHRYHI